MKTQTLDKPLSKKAQKEADRQEAIARLRTYLKPGDTVYTVLRHCSRSGMSRRIDLYAMVDNQPLWLSSLAARAMDMRLSDNQGIVVGGCGMDMGFHLVYSLGHALFPGGFGTLGLLPPFNHEIRPRTKEEAAKAVEQGAQFRGRNCDASGWDNDGGYALRHSWM